MTQTNDPPTVLDIGLIPNSNEKADLDAPSDSDGKLVIGQAPNITITETTVVADAAERLALDVQEGDIAIQTNVSTSFIFTGGDNTAPNWETLDFDAVGAIDGENINPSGISGANINTAAAGEALTSNGSGNLVFQSAGGIETVSTFQDLPTPNPPALVYVQDIQRYFAATGQTEFDFPAGIAEGDTFSNSFANPQAVRIEDAGTKMIVIPDEPLLERYDLSSANDITTATLTSSFSLNTGSQAGGPRGFCFSNDGLTLVAVDNSDELVRQYDLNTAYDITTASQTASFQNVNDDPSGVTFNNDGTQLFVSTFQTPEGVDVYNLSSAFDISTATFDFTLGNGDFAVADPFTNPTDLAFNPSGTQLFVTDNGTNGLTQFTLSSAFDLTTVTDNVFFDTVEDNIHGIDISEAGNQILTCGFNFDRIQEYTLPIPVGYDILKSEAAFEGQF